MHFKHLRGHGFTTVELIFFVIVICVLSGLILATHKGIEQKQDNTERQRDIDELRVEMEAYYSQYNKYPTRTEVNNPTWRKANMKGLSPETLRDPESKSYQLASKPGKNVYSYDVTSASGRACDDTRVVCTQYTLTATLAGGGTYTENNLE